MMFVLNLLVTNHIKVVYIRLSFVMLTVTVSQQVFADWTFPGYCAQKNSYIRDPNLPVSTRLPPLPVLPKTFQVQVEAQLLDRKVTKTGKIFYDERRKRATVKMFANNQLSTSIFDFDINQTIFVNNGSCYVRDYLTTDQSILIGAKQTGNSTSGTLNFDKANGLLYKGRKTVRDINCDWWQSCISWPQANFTLDYYFSAYNWSSPSSPRQVPVLAEILGSKYMIPQDVPIHHIYEYFDFRNKIWEDNSVFEVPSGLICPGLPITKTVPNLPQTFSFNEEIISTDGVQSGSVYYDNKAKIFRSLYTSSFSSNLMYVIEDFNTGNSYTVDTKRGSCTISPISDTSFSTTSLNSKHIRIRAAQELFFLDNTTYAYTGTKTIRGILCDVFISPNTGFHLTGFHKFDSTFEIYFTHDKWLHASNMVVPVQMRITTPDYVGVNWTYNFYDFTVGQRSNEIFSIRSCFNHKSQTSFKISFPGLWDHSLTSYQNMLILKITELISKLAHVPQLRIQDRQLIISTDSFYFIATLLDKPSSTGLTQFTTDNVSMTSAMTELKNNVIIGNFSLTVNISGQLRMIKADSIQENIDGSELETLSSNTGMNKFTVQVNKAVPGFSGIIFTGLSIDECATRCLNELLIICNAFTYSLTSGYCSLLNIRPNEVPAIIQNTMSSYLYIKKYTVDFEMIPGTTVLSSSNTVYHVNSVEMCAKLCISYKSFSCKSFEFCNNTSTCVLGHSHFYDIPKSYMKDSAICNHYSRKYLSDFKPMGNLYLTPVYDRVISGVNVEQCAKLCVEEEGLKCASFAYCFNTTECRPRRKRNISQVSSLLIPPKCNVYNRETYRDGTPYSSISSSTTIPPTSTDTPKTVSSSGPTTSINTSTTTQTKVQSSSTKPTKPTSKDGQTTNNYKEGLTEKIVLKDSSSSPIVKKGLSAGGVVGVAFGMLTAGLLIALIALAGIKRIKKKQTNEMKSTLTEHELE